jgi:hypothetical protein
MRSPHAAASSSHCEFADIGKDIVQAFLLPRLPLGSLASLALASGAWAAQVVAHVEQPAPWRRGHDALTRLLAAETEDALHRSLLEVDAKVVELDDDVARAASGAPFEIPRKNECLGTPHFERNGERVGTGLATQRAHLALTISAAERTAMRRLLRAVALRLPAARFVQLVSTLRSPAHGLQGTWHDFRALGAIDFQQVRYSKASGGQAARCDMSCLRWDVPPTYKLTPLPACATPWSVHDVVALHRAFGGAGAALASMISEQSLWAEASVEDVAALAIEGLPDTVKAAELLVGLFTAGAPLDEAA